MIRAGAHGIVGNFPGRRTELDVGIRTGIRLEVGYIIIIAAELVVIFVWPVARSSEFLPVRVKP